MAGSKSDYFENRVLELAVGKTAMSLPTAYLALYTADPGDAGGGTEVSGGSYARKVTAGSDWNAANNGSISNSQNLVFATPTASWGVVTHFAIMDALTGGNQIYHGSLASAKTIGNADTVTFAAGALVLTED